MPPATSPPRARSRSRNATPFSGRPSSPPPRGQPPLHAGRIFRHPVAKHEIEYRGEGVAGRKDRWPRPYGVFGGVVDRRQEIVDADDLDEGRVLEQPDEIVDET